MAFEGDVAPTSAKAIFISQSTKEDTALHKSLSAILGERGMISLNVSDLRTACDDARCPSEHPLVGLILGEDLIDLAAGDASATERLLRRRSTLRLSLDDLRKARERAEEIGQLGEALVDVYLKKQKDSGKIAKYLWASEVNAISPFDFMVFKESSTEKLEVKTTSGDFGRNFHVPLSELKEMARGDVPYQIARVYNASFDGAQIRISEDLRSLGTKILNAFGKLPSGVIPDEVTVKPNDDLFGKEFALEPPDEE